MHGVEVNTKSDPLASAGRRGHWPGVEWCNSAVGRTPRLATQRLPSEGSIRESAPLMTTSRSPSGLLIGEIRSGAIAQPAYGRPHTQRSVNQSAKAAASATGGRCCARAAAAAAAAAANRQQQNPSRLQSTLRYVTRSRSVEVAVALFGQSARRRVRYRLFLFHLVAPTAEN
jgi:hypothetical protein